MSALDQAFIRAYAKDQPAAMSVLPAEPACAAARPLPSAKQGAGRQAVEQLYHDGSLYRVDAPRPVARGAAAVPPPHLPLLPPTSPRRHMRRSLLKLLAEGNTAPPAPGRAEQQPVRVARKVIIRHISHTSPPPPLRLAVPPARREAVRVELAPETISNEPPASESLPAESLPAVPLPGEPKPIGPLPQEIAPLNASPFFGPQVAARDFCSGAGAGPTMLVVTRPADFVPGISAALVHVQLDALVAGEPSADEDAAAAETALHGTTGTVAFRAKSLDAVDEPAVHVRVDSPHATASHRPHVRFAPPAEREVTEDQVSGDESAAEPVAADPVATEGDREAEAQGADAPRSPVVESALDFLPEPASDEITLAEPLDEPLDGDLVPLDGDEETETARHAPPAAAAVWEVDQFHWPKTCEKLLADEGGYFVHAGEKLLAAVQDGLKVLAVTGSRRGEGRTTLSLCLTRAAAAAGIQVALMDADFARPQVASKIGLEIAFGWQDAALGKIPLSEAAVKSLADHITVLPLEPSAAGRSLSLADPRVTATLRAVGATFELVILDLGPLGGGEEIAFPQGEACPLDAAIVVRDLRFATAAESETIGRSLQDAGVEAVGIAENFVCEEDFIPSPSGRGLG